MELLQNVIQPICFEETRNIRKRLRQGYAGDAQLFSHQENGSWLLSDSHNTIQANFDQQCVKDYETKKGRSFREDATGAIISLQQYDFRIRHTESNSLFLGFEVHEFALMGGSGSPQLGRPQIVDDDRQTRAEIVSLLSSLKQQPGSHTSRTDKNARALESRQSATEFEFAVVFNSQRGTEKSQSLRKVESKPNSTTSSLAAQTIALLQMQQGNGFSSRVASRETSVAARSQKSRATSSSKPRRDSSLSRSVSEARTLLKGSKMYASSAFKEPNINVPDQKGSKRSDWTGSESESEDTQGLMNTAWMDGFNISKAAVTIPKAQMAMLVDPKSLYSLSGGQASSKAYVPKEVWDTCVLLAEALESGGIHDTSEKRPEAIMSREASSKSVPTSDPETDVPQVAPIQWNMASEQPNALKIPHYRVRNSSLPPDSSPATPLSSVVAPTGRWAKHNGDSQEVNGHPDSNGAHQRPLKRRRTSQSLEGSLEEDRHPVLSPCNSQRGTAMSSQLISSGQQPFEESLDTQELIRPLFQFETQADLQRNVYLPSSNKPTTGTQIVQDSMEGQVAATYPWLSPSSLLSAGPLPPPLLSPGLSPPLISSPWPSSPPSLVEPEWPSVEIPQRQITGSDLRLSISKAGEVDRQVSSSDDTYHTPEMNVDGVLSDRSSPESQTPRTLLRTTLSAFLSDEDSESGSGTALEPDHDVNLKSSTNAVVIESSMWESEPIVATAIEEHKSMNSVYARAVSESPPGENEEHANSQGTSSEKTISHVLRHRQNSTDTPVRERTTFEQFESFGGETHNYEENAYVSTTQLAGRSPDSMQIFISNYERLRHIWDLQDAQEDLQKELKLPAQRVIDVMTWDL